MSSVKSTLPGVSILVGAFLFAFSSYAAAVTQSEVIEHLSDIAQMMYEDSVATAKALREANSRLITEPTEQNLQYAKVTWRQSRKPYQQTEALRFGNSVVDEFEGKVNAWPLDEGLIDYVVDPSMFEGSENPAVLANIVANPQIMINGEQVDASSIDSTLLESLHEAGGIEANVATGYHAIEFLLWGQDLNGNGAGAGMRKAADFNTGACTNENCDRRGAYLMAATDLLIQDLETMVVAFSDDGEGRQAMRAGGLAGLLTGLGSLSYGELAGERTKLGLMLHDPEEEHDCFSDNTHWSHYYDVIGINNLWSGGYRRTNGDLVTGPGLMALVLERDPVLAQSLSASLQDALMAAHAVVVRAESIESYDQMIGAGNESGNAVVQNLVDALVSHARSIEKTVAGLDVSGVVIEGSDSLDDPSAVFN